MVGKEFFVKMSLAHLEDVPNLLEYAIRYFIRIKMGTRRP